MKNKHGRATIRIKFTDDGVECNVQAKATNELTLCHAIVSLSQTTLNRAKATATIHGIDIPDDFKAVITDILTSMLEVLGNEGDKSDAQSN